MIINPLGCHTISDTNYSTYNLTFKYDVGGGGDDNDEGTEGRRQAGDLRQQRGEAGQNATLQWKR